MLDLDLVTIKLDYDKTIKLKFENLLYERVQTRIETDNMSLRTRLEPLTSYLDKREDGTDIRK